MAIPPEPVQTKTHFAGPDAPLANLDGLDPVQVFIEFAHGLLAGSA
jgi:hypothetical protein